MSTGVTDHQKNRGYGNLGKPFNSKLANGPKEHHGGEREEIDSWRNHAPPQQHQQGYSAGPGAEPYVPSYYGSFQYPSGANYGVSDGGPWSNGGDMAFVGGSYSGSLHDSAPPSAHYGGIDGGVFGGGNSAGFGNFGAQPGFGYGFHGNGGDYNAWGQPRKPAYDDYYRSRDSMYGDGMKMVDGMGGLSLGDKEHSFKEMKEMISGSSKKTTWATIASQPAKPPSLMKKKGMGGMPPPPIMLGTWEKNGSVPKAPIPAPVQAPNPPAWERMDRVPKMPPPGPPPLQNHSSAFAGIPPASVGQGPPSTGRGGGSGGYPPQNHMNYNPPQPPVHQPPPQPLIPLTHSQREHNPTNSYNSHTTHTQPPPSDRPTTGKQSPASPQYPDEAKIKSDYNPSDFDLTAEAARFFVIKSYSEDDIHRSIKYEIWCSTENGNKRLDDAWREREGKGPIYLFFSVNASGHFCGMAQMMSGVDHEASSSVWCQDKWKGQFKVKWIYVKDVPNPALRHIRLENNENKSVTNSRDTQEVPHDKGILVLKILHTYLHTTSIFDDFIHYEKRQEEEDQRRTLVPSSSYSSHAHDRGNSDRGRGGRGGSYHHGAAHNDHHYPRERQDFGGHRDNQRDHHGRDRDRNDRPQHNSHSGRGGGGDGFERDRESFGGRGFDRNGGGGGGDRDFYRDRGDHRGGGSGRGGSRHPARI